MKNAFVKIIRGNEYTSYFRKYKIYINNQLVGMIRKSQELTFEISPGKHTIYNQIDWVRSNEYEFEIYSGQTIVFRCTGNLNEMAILEFIEII
jgi:hypothetical protein